MNTAAETKIFNIIKDQNNLSKGEIETLYLK